MILKYRYYLNPVRMVQKQIEFGFELNECVSFIFSQIFLGVTIQNLEDVLV